LAANAPRRHLQQPGTDELAEAVVEYFLTGSMFSCMPAFLPVSGIWLGLRSSADAMTACPVTARVNDVKTTGRN
jgi:hypothetical protein